MDFFSSFLLFSFFFLWRSIHIYLVGAFFFYWDLYKCMSTIGYCLLFIAYCSLSIPPGLGAVYC